MGGVKERLIQFVSYKRMSKRKFQERISVSNSYIQNISEGIGGEVLNRISKEFPDLNIDWLLTGKGKMLNLNNSNVTINGNENQNNIGGQMINICLKKVLKKLLNRTVLLRYKIQVWETITQTKSIDLKRSCI